MTDRKVFQDSVTPLPPQSGTTPQGLMVHAMPAENRDESMSVLFSFAMPDDKRAALEDAVARGQTVNPEELKEATAKTEDVERLKSWLTENAFANIQVSKDGAGVYATGTVEQIEKTLQVDMVRVTKNGQTFNAARNAPSLPADVGSPVMAIGGLQGFRHAHKHRAIRGPSNQNRVGMGKSVTTLPATNIVNNPPYLVREILKAYGADSAGVTGKGQTIAILIDTFADDSDVHAFWAKNDLPIVPSRVQKINVTGVHLPPVEGEETLDVEWSSGIARDATIRVYASGALDFVSLDKALDQILADAMVDKSLRQVSISLGLGETYFGGKNGEIGTQHDKFLKLAALGVSVFASSGDAGSNPDNTGHGSTGPLQAEYESSDPCVIAVGGTSLRLKATGEIDSETAWTGSGGGKSKYFARPAWQKGAGFPAGTKRLVPDVALAADPETGAFVILQGGVQTIGGTSWSAPVWAGFCALINEARASKGKTPAFLNPLLYPLKEKGCFQDVVQGENGAYESVAGYDMITGLGTPNVKKLIEELTK